MYFFKMFFFPLIILGGIIFIVLQPEAKTIYFFPGFFDYKENSEVVFYGENLSKRCQEKGFELKVTRTLENLKDIHKIVIFDIAGFKVKKLSQYPKDKLVLFLFEPPTTVPKNYKKKYHKYFSKIFTFNDALVDGKKYFKFYYPELRLPLKGQKPFLEKKLVTLIARNKTSNYPSELYTKRQDTIRSFEKIIPKEFDFYGEGWPQSDYASYKGPLKSKDILENYKFLLCYENTQKIDGYITEKIFDAFFYGCVPIYLGSGNIEKYIPKNCFIDKRLFSNDRELIEFLKKIDEKEYGIYLKAINAFLKSSSSFYFTPKYFLKVFDFAIE